MSRLPRTGALLLALTALIPGCERQDAERLGKIGRHALGKAGQTVGVVRENVAMGWQGGVGGDELAVSARVATRLKWDKSLADAKIEVIARGSTVDLKGKVLNLQQHQRAREIAMSTLGVEFVNDLLEEPDQRRPY